jgi:hypothetical protein
MLICMGNRYDVDVISPTARTLRNGETREPTYYIFSKKI